MLPRLRCAAVALVVLAVPAVAQLPTITDYTKTFEKRDGYFPVYWDGAKGRLFLEVRLGEDFLYLPSLATGLGDASLGVDRGTIGDEQIARFDRVGPRVQLVLQNPRFRAVSDNDALARSVRESFPLSTVASWEVVAEEGGRLLVDATGYVTSDITDVRGSLRTANQGTFALDRDRSAVYLAHTKGFPDNTEIETTLTFTSDNPGARVRRHTPDGRALTLRQHLSLVRLPGPGFRPRPFDPRMGIFDVSFYDFAKPFTQELVTRYAIRHRLQKRTPGAAPSEPVKPIVYYLDPGIPEPYRQAFKDGAGWWTRVFEAAGFQNAFRVEDMPADMDPLDARYNVIQWVHRTEADYSIGPSFVDPRTGEIIKAAVRMESHRSLSDYDIYAGAVPALGGEEAGELDPWLSGLTADVTPEVFAMARRRQHMAHEVGLPRPVDQAGQREARSVGRLPERARRLGHPRDPMGLYGVRAGRRGSRARGHRAGRHRARAQVHHQPRRGIVQLLSRGDDVGERNRHDRRAAAGHGGASLPARSVRRARDRSGGAAGAT